MSEQAIRYADFPMPTVGEKIKIAEGVFWVRMPLPFALDHINVWLIRDQLDEREGWTLIDTGVANDETRAAWQQLIAHHLDDLPIVRVLATHFHPDHIGLAHWLCNGTDQKLWQAPLWIDLAEYATARVMLGAGRVISESEPQEDVADSFNMAEHFHRHGITDEDTLRQLRLRRNHYPSLVSDIPASFRRIFPNESIRIGQYHWHVIPGYGHSPEHSALYCEGLNLLISGDMVLPKISTNMSVWSQEPDADPLKLYLDSLHAFEVLPDDVLVLPSHGKPFGAAPHTRAGGIKVRVEQLRQHHHDRLQETRAACKAPASAAQVMPVLFKRKLDLHQLTFALGETIAHLNHLWYEGGLKRLRDEKGRLTFLAQ